jgi:hypothetical protein
VENILIFAASLIFFTYYIQTKLNPQNYLTMIPDIKILYQKTKHFKIKLRGDLMKTKIYLLVLLQILSYNIWAGSISGEISYSGSATSTVYIAAFTDPELNSDPIFMTTITQPGSYTLSEVTDGTYYIISIMSNNPNQMLQTDPYGFWGTLDNLTPVVISGNNDVIGIDITLIDGTEENPNPFAQFYIAPDAILQLPQETEPGNNPSLVYNGSTILLYKQDYSGAGSAKIFEINPESGALLNTNYLALQSSPNGISWMDKMVYRNGDVWAYGGYGDPFGSGGIPGVFRVNISNSTSSNQLHFAQDFQNGSGLACDGTNLFIGNADSMEVGGIVKFNPDLVTEVPSNLFISFSSRMRSFTYSDNTLWVGIEKIQKFNATTSEYLGNVQIPGFAAEIFFNNKFWSYDENNNTINIYNLTSVGVEENNLLSGPEDFSLSQNYPNPFNPSTIISWQSPVGSYQTLKVFDVLGNEVATLVNEYKPAGSYSVTFEAGNLSSGIYYYTITAGDFHQTKKLVLLK